MSSDAVQGMRQFTVGAMEIRVVADGGRNVPIPSGLVTNASDQQVTAALEAGNYPKGIMPFFFNPVLVNDGGKLSLIDTGNGEAAFEQSKGAVGRVQVHLRDAGVDPAKIENVLITHFHADHINGLVAGDGAPAFPAARILVGKTEYAFWMDDDNMNRAPDEMKAQFKNVRRVFGIVGDRVKPFEDNEEVIPHVVAMATPGHTPGCTSWNSR